jgi:hypothetical protein
LAARLVARTAFPFPAEATSLMWSKFPAEGGSALAGGRVAPSHYDSINSLTDRFRYRATVAKYWYTFSLLIPNSRAKAAFFSVFARNPRMAACSVVKVGLRPL